MSNLDNFTIFDYLYDEYKIKKPIRLIELFAGYGSQALALKYLGVNFEHWKICEWAVKSIQAYKDIHFTKDNKNYSEILSKDEIIEYLHDKGVSANYNEPMKLDQIKRLNENQLRTIFNNIKATHNLVNIAKVKGGDLDICDTENYDYIMTYSFPCQDLSLAGLQKGMSKGSSTRSGMLWEVERILDELHQEGKHIKILLMENVPQVVGTNNIADFKKWLAKLESLGYSNYCETINAKDYLIPQNRERTFMISIHGEYNYNFPKSEILQLRLKDLLESNVDEKYYLTNSQLKSIASWKAQQDPLKDIDKEKIICPTLTARGAGENHSGMVLINESLYNPNNKILKVGKYTKGGFSSGIIVDSNGIAPTGMEHHGNLTAVVENPNLKSQLCNSLIEKGLVKENDVIRHNYTTSKNENCIQANNESPTLDTRCDCLGVVVKEKYQGMYQYAKSDNFMQGKDRFTKNKELTDTLQTTPKEAVCLNVEKKIIPFGSYFTWQDNQGNINTQCNRAGDPNGCALTIACANTGNVYENYLRIRKLTPKECFRLMGVKDEDFENVAKNQSNASLYHLAGDSIVTTCLMALFSKLLDINWVEKWSEDYAVK